MNGTSVIRGRLISGGDVSGSHGRLLAPTRRHKEWGEKNCYKQNERRLQGIRELDAQCSMKVEEKGRRK